jgi:serine/threonine protein kinase
MPPKLHRSGSGADTGMTPSTQAGTNATMSQTYEMAVHSGEKRSSTDQMNAASSRKPNKFRWVRHIDKEYHIGPAVIPSTHKGREVRHATRLSDNLQVVIKIRDKTTSFKDDEDVTTWIDIMEHLYSIGRKDQKSNHPGIHFVCQIHDLVEDQSAHYVVMQKMNGLDLFEFTHRSRLHEARNKPALVKKIAYDCASALAYYKEWNLIHKDLKLENCCLHENPETKRCTLMIIDFDTVEEYQGPNYTCYDVMGTDQYIAPEAYAGKYSSASDVFAFGVMLYKLATAKFPFHDDIFDDEPGQNCVGHRKMKEIKCKLKLAKIDFNVKNLMDDKNLRDLVKKCLSYDCHRRISVDQILRHPYFHNAQAETRNLTWSCDK